MTDEFPTTVRDTSGSTYELGAVLGRGGQGAVLQVRGRPLAVKLSFAGTPTARSRVQESIARVKRLPLDGLHVARPLRALDAPHVGYVMELMTGMEPLSRLCQVPADRAVDLVPWYLDTGSLRRRLRLLAGASEVLASLHARGLSYGDASPANIYVSSDRSAVEAWLIDCDNVSSGVGRRSVYTPGYAAPELFRSRGTDSLTDAWSMATIAFETLCVLHPFVGDRVHDGEPSEEERAFRGELPWVDAPGEENAASRGIPRSMVLTPDLRGLAAACFGASRQDRQQRPGVATWAEKLHRAADQTLICPECGSSYYLVEKSCPWCDRPRPGFALASVYLRDPELTDSKRNPFSLVCREPGRPRPVARVALLEGESTQLSARVLTGAKGSEPLLDLAVKERQLSVRGLEHGVWVLRHRSGKVLPLADRPEHLDLAAGSRGWWLLPAQSSRLHRALSFEWIPEVRS